jgi:hypothetical protein
MMSPDPKWRPHLYEDGMSFDEMRRLCRIYDYDIDTDGFVLARNDPFAEETEH